VHSPDRLARKYAYQVLLVDEFQRAGVEVMFLNRELGHSPEDELLLQVQGMMAEYGRAKIIERHRRGKRHAARAGSVNVLVAAPYGYRYIPKPDGGGQARDELLAEEARVVRQMFDWVGRERVTIGDVCRRLSRAGEPTRTGKAVWDRSVVWGMLRNPAYRGPAAFGKTRQGPPRPRLRAQRGRPLQPRRATAPVEMPREEWITIPEGLIEKHEFEPRITHLRQRVTNMEAQAHQLADEAALHAELQLIIRRLEDFAAQVNDGLADADWTSRRELIRALVKRVEVARDQVHVVFRVEQRPGDPSSGKKVCNFVGGVRRLPCIVPASVGNHVPWSTAPAWSQALSWRRRLGLALTLASKAVWSIRSKHFSISASRTYLALWPMAVKMASIAS
jgi:hypothetical protein